MSFKMASIFFLSIIMMFLSACSKSPEEIARETAKEIEKVANESILQSNDFSKYRRIIPLHSNGFKKGIDQEFWSADGRLLGKANDFSKIDNYQLLLKKDVDITINIRGITDAIIGQGIKEVQFTWKYDELPSLAKRFTVDGGEGVAYFRLFDDGWRLADIKISPNKKPATQSQTELAQEINDEKQIYEAKKRKENEIALENERIKKIVNSSTTLTKNIGSFAFEWTGKWQGFNERKVAQIDVTDVGIRIRYTSRGSFNTVQTDNAFCWFGDINSITTESNQNNYPYNFTIIKIIPRSRFSSNFGNESIEKPNSFYSNDSRNKDAVLLINSALLEWRENNKEVYSRRTNNMPY